MAEQLPRTSEESGIVVYRIRKRVRRGSDVGGAADSDEEEDRHCEVSKLERVRRCAVLDYLTFFNKHHKYFNEGIMAKDGSYLVRPIEISGARINALPEDGVLTGPRVPSISKKPPHF